MVGILTAGITLAMLFLGGTVDWIGVRKSLLISLSFMLFGRLFLTIAPDIGIPGLWQSAHLITLLGMLGIVLGYGIYQPACYAGVKKFTDEKTSAMGYAMLYALMNLGGFLPGLISPPIRKSFGILGVYWVFSALTIVGILVVAILMSKKAIKDVEQKAIEEDNTGKSTEDSDSMESMSPRDKLIYYLKNFPIRDGRFMFFMFIIMCFLFRGWRRRPYSCWWPGWSDYRYKEKSDVKEILKKRYVKGEISKEEYDGMMKDLS